MADRDSGRLDTGLPTEHADDGRTAKRGGRPRIRVKGTLFTDGHGGKRNGKKKMGAKVSEKGGKGDLVPGNNLIHSLKKGGSGGVPERQHHYKGDVRRNDQEKRSSKAQGVPSVTSWCG